MSAAGTRQNGDRRRSGRRFRVSVEDRAEAELPGFGLERRSWIGYGGEVPARPLRVQAIRCPVPKIPEKGARLDRRPRLGGDEEEGFLRAEASLPSQYRRRVRQVQDAEVESRGGGPEHVGQDIRGEA